MGQKVRKSAYQHVHCQQSDETMAKSVIFESSSAAMVQVAALLQKYLHGSSRRSHRSGDHLCIVPEVLHRMGKKKGKE